MVTGQAAVVAIIGQFKVLLFAILIVSPLVLFLRKPRPASQTPGARQMTSAYEHPKGSGRCGSHRAISALAFLPGCKVGPNYTRPADPASKQYDQQAEKQLSAAGGPIGAQRIGLGQKINGDWWSTFASAEA